MRIRMILWRSWKLRIRWRMVKISIFIRVRFKRKGIISFRRGFSMESFCVWFRRILSLIKSILFRFILLNLLKLIRLGIILLIKRLKKLIHLRKLLLRIDWEESWKDKWWKEVKRTNSHPFIHILSNQKQTSAIKTTT
jgi:hypothetical protein